MDRGGRGRKLRFGFLKTPGNAGATQVPEPAGKPDLRSKLKKYLWQEYEFRFNVLTGQAEYLRKDAPDGKYRATTFCSLNTLCLGRCKSMELIVRIKM